MNECTSDDPTLTTKAPGSLRFTAAAPFSLEGVQLSSQFLNSGGLYRWARVFACVSMRVRVRASVRA